MAKELNSTSLLIQYQKGILHHLSKCRSMCQWFGICTFPDREKIYSVADDMSEIAWSELGVKIIIDRLVVKAGERKTSVWNAPKGFSFIGIWPWRRNALSVFSWWEESLIVSPRSSLPNLFISQKELSLSTFLLILIMVPVRSAMGLDPLRLFEQDIVNPNLTLLRKGVITLDSTHPYYSSLLEVVCRHEDIDMNIKYGELSEQQKEDSIWYGWKFWNPICREIDEGKTHRAKYEWLIPNLERRYRESDMGNDAFLNVSQTSSPNKSVEVVADIDSKRVSFRIGMRKNIGNLPIFLSKIHEYFW